MTTLPLAGKVCLVTGASSGIGKVTAREVAGLRARVTWSAAAASGASAPCWS